MMPAIARDISKTVFLSFFLPFILITLNIMTSHNQTPIRIGTSGPTWVTVEEAEITHCYLRFGCGEGMRVWLRKFCRSGSKHENAQILLHSPHCKCGMGKETMEYYLLERRRFKEQRKEMIKKKHRKRKTKDRETTRSITNDKAHGRVYQKHKTTRIIR